MQYRWRMKSHTVSTETSSHFLWHWYWYRHWRQTSTWPKGNNFL